LGRRRVEAILRDSGIGGGPAVERVERNGAGVEQLRIALVVPPMLPVPPPGYAGTERVVATIVEELHARGHDVTLYASGDSRISGRLVAVVPEALWARGYRGNVSAYMALSIARIWRDHDQYDVIHAHTETEGFLFARHCPTPVVTTLHGRLDSSGVPALLEEFTDIPLVSISQSQRRWGPHANWVGTIHHGLELASMPFSEQTGDYLALIGRVTPEKGVAEAIELAERTNLPLRIGAKVYDSEEKAFFQEVVVPAVETGGVEFLGELAPAERDQVYAGALATLMLGAWPEPFGLVAIESLATGTPVIARRAGALPEIVEHGVDGYLVDDLTEAQLAVELVRDLDRTRIRKRALERFSPGRMVDEYLEVYRRLIAEHARAPQKVTTTG
jgi:glycosyltransferase involved in cell wall biosynthesis